MSANTITKWLDKGIISAIYIFAFGSLISKALMITGMGLSLIFWTVRVVIKKSFQLKGSKLDWAILLFILSIIFSSLDAWRFDLLTNKYFFAIIFFYIMINSVTELRTIKLLIYTTMTSMGISLFYGLYQHFFLNQTRIGGFSFSLSFGGFLAIFLMYSLSYFLWGDLNKWSRLSLIGASIVMFLDLLYTKSRGAWLGFIGGLFSLAWLKDKKLIIIIVLFYVIVAFILPQTFIDRFKSSFNLTDNRSNLGRIALWEGAILMFRDHPVNGVGLNNFQKSYEANYVQPNTVTTVHAHNNFLNFAAETGIPGLLAFSWLMITIIRYLYQGYNQITNTYWALFVLASLGAVIVFNIQGLTEFNFGDTEPLHFFWFLIGLNVLIITKLSSANQG